MAASLRNIVVVGGSYVGVVSRSSSIFSPSTWLSFLKNV